MESQFLQLISHELRTPLTGIRGYSDLLGDERSGRLTDRQRYMLTMLNSCVHRLDSLVDDLLLLAEVDAGVHGLVVEDLDLARLCDQAVRAHAAHARPDEPVVRCAYTGGCVVQGDPRQLGHLVVALLNHAVGRFAGSAQITVEATGDGTIRVTADDADDEPAGIAGLGLAVVHMIAEQHGGTVTVRKGAVEVSLPRTVPAGPDLHVTRRRKKVKG